MSRWFRWYEGTAEDGKFRVVARKSRVTIRDVLALWAFMLEDAAHLDHRGVCQRDEDFMASVLDFDDGVVERILSAMQDVNMISVGHGGITVCNWNKRQFESDSDPTAARRQREKRERDKEVSHAAVTRDTGGSETEADTENRKEKKDSWSVANATRPEVSRTFEEFWKAYPKRKGPNPKGPSRKLFEAAVKSGADPQAIIAGARRYAADERERIGTEFIPHTRKWLHGRCWEDYAADVVPDGTISEEERQKLFAKLRENSNGRQDVSEGKGLRPTGIGPRENETARGQGSTGPPNHRAGNSGLVSMATVFHRTPRLRADSDETGEVGDEQEQQDDGPRRAAG